MTLNLSFQQGIFPEALKTAKVTPIFKKECPQLSSKYRRIFVLSVFSKLYEKCMYSRLFAFLAKYKLLFKKQFGFRNNLSTSNALINVIDLIKKNLYNHCFFCRVFIDLQKAFDTVNHEILPVKLDFYGICGLANRWLKLFFEIRKQYVNLPGHSSNLYINDLQSVYSKSVIHHFVDDTNFYFLPKNVVQLNPSLTINLSF